MDSKKFYGFKKRKLFSTFFVCFPRWHAGHSIISIPVSPIYYNNFEYLNLAKTITAVFSTIAERYKSILVISFSASINYNVIITVLQLVYLTSPTVIHIMYNILILCVWQDKVFIRPMFSLRITGGQKF